jgi:glycosyltransferase involved in cell wall biosynthesis
VDDAERAATRERIGVAPDAFVALYAGRLVREKGIAVLREAWARATLPAESVLVVAGDGPLAYKLAGMPGRAGAVNALGRVPRAELPALYAAADVLILPSIPTATFREPWGLVVNEAMLQGTPVIVSDAVGAAAGGLAVDGRTGFVVPAGDSAALAARISALAGSPGLRERMGRDARAQVAAYTPEAWAAGMTRALAAVGASRR